MKENTMKLSFWRQIFEDWMNKNGYDLDKTDCMWAVLSFVQHLEHRDANNPDFITNRFTGQAGELNRYGDSLRSPGPN